MSSSLPNDVSSGAGTQSDPYVLSSNSGTVTLETGKYYVLKSGTTIGTMQGSNANTAGTGTSASTGGIVVNGASLEVQDGSQINGKLDLSATGSSVMMDTPSSWVVQTNLPGHTAVGSQTYGYPALQNAAVAGLLNNDGTPNTNVSFVMNGIPLFAGSSGTIGISGGYGSGTSGEQGSTFTVAQRGSGTVYGANVVIPTSYANASSGGFSSVALPYTKLSGTNSYNVNNGKTTYTCFLAGTMIRTPAGEVAVEDLAFGDEIVAMVDGAERARKIIWAGKASAMAQRGVAEDEAGFPVRILKDAVAEGVPYKDLLVTAEHCLLLDGAFIPARMLVNGRSVFYDHSLAVFDYYHIETESHSVIIADGMLSESYLDTGNRSSFRQDGGVVSFPQHGSVRSWEEHAAAPLCVERSFVEPIFRRIEARAVAAGIASQIEAAALVDDAGLHLITENGSVIHPARVTNSHTVFIIPDGVEAVWIASRASRPSEMVGPFVDDRRELGVMVGSITFFESFDARQIRTHLTEDALTGWWGLEATPCRWTNGNAYLPLGRRPAHSRGTLAIEVLATGPYLEEAVQRFAVSA